MQNVTTTFRIMTEKFHNREKKKYTSKSVKNDWYITNFTRYLDACLVLFYAKTIPYYFLVHSLLFTYSSENNNVAEMETARLQRDAWWKRKSLNASHAANATVS